MEEISWMNSMGFMLKKHYVELAYVRIFSYLCNEKNNKIMCKEKIKIEKCPYCGSENFEHMGDNDYGMPWYCHECDRWFYWYDMYELSTEDLEAFLKELRNQ